jgi:hypothetical protein
MSIEGMGAEEPVGAKNSQHEHMATKADVKLQEHCAACGRKHEYLAKVSHAEKPHTTYL